MEITEEQKQAIIKEALQFALKKRNYRSFSYHMNRLGRYIAQVEIDKEALLLASFTTDKIIKLYVIQAVINETHAKRVAAEGKGSAPGEKFQSLLKKMKTYRKALIIVLNYVRKRADDHTLSITADKIKKGNSQIDIIRDVSALAEVLKQYPTLAQEITPAGMKFTEEYLGTVYAEAQEALNLDGVAEQTESERSQLVDLQLRLINLSMETIDDLREFAKAAFLLDYPYYRAHYIYSDHEKHASSDEEDDLDILDDDELA